jgi:RNA polymerase sigma-70 factor (ECF subfamily)
LKVISIFKNPIQLLKHAAANDRKAQQALYKAYTPKMLAVCKGYITDVRQAEEVMMNGFLKVFSSMNAFENKGSFEGWFRKILVREAISFLKSI